MGADWLDGVEHMPSAHNGGSMLGGPPRFTWHTYEAGYALSAHDGARNLIAAGNEVSLTFHPITGDVVQILPASVASRGLLNAAGGVQTNRIGTAHLQCEVIARASRPWTADLTDAGRHGLARIVDFARSHGIPDVWPAGPPPAYVDGRGNVPPSPRSATIWTTKAGHYGHSQVPENDHGDPGAIDPAAIFAIIMQPPQPQTEEIMIIHASSDSPDGSVRAGMVFHAEPGRRRWLTDPAVIPAFAAAGIRWADLPGKVVAEQWPYLIEHPEPIDVDLLAQHIVGHLPPAATVDVAALAAALAPQIHAGATTDDVRAILTGLRLTV